jgi:hypothetical protein
MDIGKGNKDTLRSATVIASVLLASCLWGNTAVAQAAEQGAVTDAAREGQVANSPAAEKEPPTGPVDEFNGAAPRTALKGFLKAAGNGDFAVAAQYLDLSKLPVGQKEGPGDS